MSYLVVKTNHAHYFINAEEHTHYVDSVGVLLKAIISEAFSDPTKGPRCFTEAMGRNREFKQKVPVYVGDVSFDGYSWHADMRAIGDRHRQIACVQMGLGFLKLLGGIAGIIQLFKTYQQRKMTRRQFFKLSLIGGSAGAMYLISDFLDTNGIHLQEGEITDYDLLSKKFEHWWLGHVGEYVLHIRNAVIAEKAETCIAGLYQGMLTKPDIGIYYGGFHQLGIAEMLGNPLQRKKYLEIGRKAKHLLHNRDCWENVYAFEYNGGTYRLKDVIHCPGM